MPPILCGDARSRQKSGCKLATEVNSKDLKTHSEMEMSDTSSRQRVEDVEIAKSFADARALLDHWGSLLPQFGDRQWTANFKLRQWLARWSGLLTLHPLTLAHNYGGEIYLAGLPEDVLLAGTLVNEAKLYKSIILDLRMLVSERWLPTTTRFYPSDPICVSREKPRFGIVCAKSRVDSHAGTAAQRQLVLAEINGSSFRRLNNQIRLFAVPVTGTAVNSTGNGTAVTGARLF
ncbi:hypothetical protein B0H19DRAFT_1063148 [Mycena capillaripes]|nr:hypothetical protein B0H19DRAFT_1063148 [Mycena capillaripes]